MKDRMKKAAVLLAVLLAWLGFGQGASQAREENPEPRGTKEAVVVDEAKRAFRLDYRVWAEGDWEAESRDVLFLLDASAAAEGQARKGVEDFLEGLSQTAPSSRAGLVLFGEETESVAPSLLDKAGLEKLEEALSSAKSKAKGKPDYGKALGQAQKLAQKLEKGRPLILVTITSGQWAGDRKACLETMDSLRDGGAESYTVLLCAEAKEEVTAFWRDMSSSPLASHHFLCGEEAGPCLDKVRRDVSGVETVEVVQRLDPRFSLEEKEVERLEDAGACAEETDGVWTVTWGADFPRTKESPWKASLTVRAKDEFPGGNDVCTDEEETGLYRGGKLIDPLPETRVNVPVSLKMKDLESELFLGQRVKVTLNGKKIEGQMAPGEDAWFGKAWTGSVSCTWETAAGKPVGSLWELEALRPERDTTYRLRASYRPESSGKNAVGNPVKPVEAVALYRVKVTAGVLRIKVTGKEELPADSSLRFRIQRDDGRVFFSEANPEADPESGRIFLEAELDCLPYGRYTVTPLGKNGLPYRESAQTCQLGVWDRDDTISPRRNRTWLNFSAPLE